MGREKGRKRRGKAKEGRGKCEEEGEMQGTEGERYPLIQIPASALAAPRVNSRVYVPVCRSDLREGDGAVSDVECRKRHRTQTEFSHL